ncbi:peptidase family M50-domain-containing protein [Lentinula boryana]|uniref:Endopeptidase S2P n=1 Tax=Lentinula boryana TaxID=40481 RepID=A0ABQ8QSS4_9AGAR|nr:peptidase family M50-domain-containing protein [Lentinula boryana]
MPLSHAISIISLVWVIIHIVYRVWKPKAALLPTFNNVPRARSWVERSTTVTLNKVQLKIQTTAFNARHDELASKLRDRRSKQLRKWTAVFYSIGVIAGICGLFLGLVVLLWITGQSLLSLVFPTSSRLHSHQKRDLDSAAPAHFDASNYIRPVIPGLTVPWAHLPIIIVAVCLCQIVHELGHALAGALYSVPILSSGISLTLVIPSAFVSFSAGFMSSLDVFSRARIIAAGPWHNLVLWILLVSLGKTAVLVERTTGVGTMLVNLGWEDLSKEGRMVVGIDDDSPLNAVLRAGSMITALDDISLASEEDRWSQYLMPQIPIDVPWYGWCVSQELFRTNSAECCKDAHPTLDRLCFDSLGRGKGCLNPIPILSTSDHQFRCKAGSDCNDDAVCVQPDSSSSILRLSVQGQDLILWNGPRSEIWEQVSVDRYAPRLWFVPSTTIRLLREFWSYLQMATLSLFIFNLLPLPFLDGAQLLSALMDYAYPVLEPNNDLETGGVSAGLWKQRLERLVQFGTLCLIALYFLLGSLWGSV